MCPAPSGRTAVDSQNIFHCHCKYGSFCCNLSKLFIKLMWGLNCGQYTVCSDNQETEATHLNGMYARESLCKKKYPIQLNLKLHKWCTENPAKRRGGTRICRMVHSPAFAMYCITLWTNFVRVSCTSHRENNEIQPNQGTNMLYSTNMLYPTCFKLLPHFLRYNGESCMHLLTQLQEEASI